MQFLKSPDVQPVAQLHETFCGGPHAQAIDISGDFVQDDLYPVEVCLGRTTPDQQEVQDPAHDHGIGELQSGPLGDPGAKVPESAQLLPEVGQEGLLTGFKVGLPAEVVLDIASQEPDMLARFDDFDAPIWIVDMEGGGFTSDPGSFLVGHDLC